MEKIRDPGIPLTKSLQPNAQVSGPVCIFQVKAHEMLETLSPNAARSLQVVLPAHAAEPAATSGNAARSGDGWRAPLQADKLNALLPGGGSDALTFSNTTVFGQKSDLGRCQASPATEELEAERRAAREGAGGATLYSRGRSDLAAGCSDHGGRESSL